MSKVRVTWTESILVGVVLFGLIGTGVVLLFYAGLVYLIRSEVLSWREFDPTMMAFALTATALAGAAAWRLIVATPESSSVRGAFAGLVAGIVAHPLCWFLLLVFQTVWDPNLRRQSLTNIFFNVVFMTLLMTISSLGLVGWITAPIGATLGYAAKRLNRHYALAHNSEMQKKAEIVPV